MAKRGAKSIFEAEKRNALIAALRAVKGIEGNTLPSRFLQKQMEERGLIAFDTVKSGGRGRPQHVAKVTPKGQAYINFAK